jgi:hypothetical protein
MAVSPLAVGAHTSTLPFARSCTVYPVGVAGPEGSTGKSDIYVGIRHPSAAVGVVISEAIALVIFVGADEIIGPHVNVLAPIVNVPAKTPLLSAILCPIAFRIALTFEVLCVFLA